MRFMVFMIPDVYQPGKKVDPHFMPPAEAIERMGRFNAELQKAGAVLELQGLHPLTAGARISYAGGKAKVTDGPFVEAKEVVGGYWLLQAKSKEEVVEWMKRCPAEPGDVIEVRQVFELEEFSAEAQAAAKRARS
jgi:hypothetical protein